MQVYVCHLPRDCLEDELVPIFLKIGRIYLMRMMMDFSGMNRGFCFVTYANPTMASHAIESLNNYQVNRSRYNRVRHNIWTLWDFWLTCFFFLWQNCGFSNLKFWFKLHLDIRWSYSHSDSFSKLKITSYTRISIATNLPSILFTVFTPTKSIVIT